MFQKKNASLIIGFSLPILMILFVAISIYIPQFFIHPKYNFLYSSDDGYSYTQYTVGEDGHIAQRFETYNAFNANQFSYPKLYIYNVATDQNTAVTYQEAQKLSLDSSIDSPDGFRLEQGNNSDGIFPFFDSGRSTNAEFLVGHNASKKVSLKYLNANYYSPVHFLGWIMQ